jgi:UDP-N-acetylglucosamine 1-carboxyvinyltransferase
VATLAILRVYGPTPLGGTLPTLGAKNASLPLLAASVLIEDGASELVGVPDLSDVGVMVDILRTLGVAVAAAPYRDGQMRLAVDATGRLDHEVPPPLMARMRSSVFLLGPLLARAGRARIAYPGGCDIGSRPIDLHLRGLARLGARIEERDGRIEATAPAGGLVGGAIRLDLPSVGATENLIMAAVRARGETVIAGAAREPEIVDLARFLTAAGARIEGAGEDTVRVRGVGPLSGVRHAVIADRIEAGTLLFAAAASGGELRLEGAVAGSLDSVLAVLRASGAEVAAGPGDVAVRAPTGGRPRPVDVRTLPYPGFPTDLQPVLTAYLARAHGTSVVQETIFESRFRHASALVRLGARIRVVGRTAVIDGVPRLVGAPVAAGDLRAAGALVVAAVGAEGVSDIAGLDHLERGYQDLGGRLNAVGARVERVGDAGEGGAARVEARVS